MGGSTTPSRFILESIIGCGDPTPNHFMAMRQGNCYIPWVGYERKRAGFRSTKEVKVLEGVFVEAFRIARSQLFLIVCPKGE
ncbi:MAG: hypothetical protein CMF45_08885 [Legionellales bacterium]|nr:hypothetical protein [Legionellales bacterium]